MKKYTKVYIDHFYGGDSTDICCEICKTMYNHHTTAVDVHHIGGRGSGGSKLLDRPEKLMALCRDHHEACECGEIDDNAQIKIHIDFADENCTPINEDIAWLTLQEMTEKFKQGTLETYKFEV